MSSVHPSFLLPKITFKKQDESETIWTYNAWSPPSSGARIIGAFFEDIENDAAPFEIRIEDSGEALDSDIINGIKVIAEIGPSTLGLQGFVGGYVREVEPVFPDTNAREIILRGFTNPVRYQERVLNYYRIAERLSNTATPDLTDTAMRVSQLFKDAHTSSDVWPFGNLLPFTVVDDVEDIGDVLCSIRQPFTSMKSVLDTIAAAAGVSYGVGYDNKAYLRYATAMHSGVTLNGVGPDVEVLADATTGYFVGPWSYTLSIKPQDGFANVLVGMGGAFYQLDVSKVTDSDSAECYTVDRAAQFTPKVTRLDGLNFKLSKTGTLSEDITGSVVLDEADTPEGDEVGTFSIFKNLIGDSAAWTPQVALTMADRRLLVGQKYWVILNKQGDVSNHFLWHHDAGTGATEAERATDTWTVDTTGRAFTLQTFRSRQIVSMLSNPVSTARYGIIERRVDAPQIVEGRAMDILLSSILRYSSQQHMIFKPNTIWAPETILHAGTMVRVKEPRTNLDVAAEIMKVRYSFGTQGGNIMGTRHVGLELVGFTP